MRRPRWLHRSVVENGLQIGDQLSEVRRPRALNRNTKHEMTQVQKEERLTEVTPKEELPSRGRVAGEPSPGSPVKDPWIKAAILLLDAPAREGGRETRSRLSSGPTGPLWGMEPKGDRVWGSDPRRDQVSPEWSVFSTGQLEHGKWKTKLCNLFYGDRGCKFGRACSFAHGTDDLMPLALDSDSEPEKAEPRQGRAPTAGAAHGGAPTVGPTAAGAMASLSLGHHRGQEPLREEWPLQREVCHRYWDVGWCSVPSCPFGHEVTRSAARRDTRRPRDRRDRGWSARAIAREKEARSLIICPAYWQKGHCDTPRCPMGHGLTRSPATGSQPMAAVPHVQAPSSPPRLRWKGRRSLAQRAADARAELRRLGPGLDHRWLLYGDRMRSPSPPPSPSPSPSPSPPPSPAPLWSERSTMLSSQDPHELLQRAEDRHRWEEGRRTSPEDALEGC